MSDYDLVMPFVVCESNGGPYQDAAFVAGVTFGQILHTLQSDGPVIHACYVKPDLTPQLDLLAMGQGYTLTVESAEDGWVLATFRKVEP